MAPFLQIDGPATGMAALVKWLLCHLEVDHVMETATEAGHES